MQDFLLQGGVIRYGIARLDGTQLPLRADVLSAAVSLKNGGFPIIQQNGIFIIGNSTSGLFHLPPEHLANGLFMLVGRYVADEYANLDVADATVLDIGAHIGDSAVYFHRRGAKLVHAYEPFRPLYEVALRNIRLNSSPGEIQLFNLGVGATVDEFLVSFDIERSCGASTVRSPRCGDGMRLERVRIIPFVEIVERAVRQAGGSRIVCKIDCEGAEFEALLSDSSREALQALNEIVVETHRRPPEAIERRLRESGFQTSVTAINSEIHLIQARKLRTEVEV